MELVFIGVVDRMVGGQLREEAGGEVFGKHDVLLC